MLTIENHGPLITRTNYWESDLERAGAVYVSINAGAFRVLLPRGLEGDLPDMQAARECVVSRGPWPGAPLGPLADAIEILFDDGSASPYALHLAVGSLDRLPADEDAGREWLLTVWKRPRRGRPHKALERRCYYRRSPRLPDLRAGNET